MKTDVPKFVVECLQGLRDERVPLAARIDAIDLAVDNLNRVYGLHGTPQPLPLERRQVRRPRTLADAVKRHAGKPQGGTEAKGDTSVATERREALLSAITKSAVGLTAAELRAKFPKYASQDRSNTLNNLKLAGKIKRSGNTWVAAA